MPKLGRIWFPFHLRLGNNKTLNTAFSHPKLWQILLTRWQWQWKELYIRLACTFRIIWWSLNLNLYVCIKFSSLSVIHVQFIWLISGSSRLVCVPNTLLSRKYGFYQTFVFETLSFPLIYLFLIKVWIANCILVGDHWTEQIVSVWSVVDWTFIN
jgi:hypothetical protein